MASFLSPERPYDGWVQPTGYIDPLAGIDRTNRWKTTFPTSAPASTSVPSVSVPNTQQAVSLPNPQPFTNNSPYISNNDYWRGVDSNFNSWYKDYGNKFDTPQAALDFYRINGAKVATEQPGFLSQLGSGILDNFTSNPLSFAGGLFNLYQGFQQYKYAKQNLALQRDAYNFNKQMAQNAERRNQEQWDMLKRQRASSSL